MQTSDDTRGWPSSDPSQAARRRLSSMTASTPRSMRCLTSIGLDRPSTCFGSALNPVYLHEAVSRIVDAADELAGVLVEPGEEALAVRGGLGAGEIAAHARVEEHHVGVHACQALVERQAFVGEVEGDQKRAHVQVLETEPVRV